MGVARRLKVKRRMMREVREDLESLEDQFMATKWRRPWKRRLRNWSRSRLPSAWNR